MRKWNGKSIGRGCRGWNKERMMVNKGKTIKVERIMFGNSVRNRVSGCTRWKIELCSHQPHDLWLMLCPLLEPLCAHIIKKKAHREPSFSSCTGWAQTVATHWGYILKWVWTSQNQSSNMLTTLHEEKEMGCYPDRAQTWCVEVPLGQRLSIGRRRRTERCCKADAAAVRADSNKDIEWIPSCTSDQRQALTVSPSIASLFSVTFLQVKHSSSKTCPTEPSATHTANPFLPSSLPLTRKDPLRPLYFIFPPLPHPSHIVFTPID